MEPAWRALIGEDFTKANVCLLAQGLADLMTQHTRIAGGGAYFVLGYDRRFIG